MGVNRPQKRDTPSDLIPGFAAAAVFLLLFLLHLTPLWASAGLAVGVYFGVKLLLPAPKPQAEPIVPLPQLLATVFQQLQTLPPGRARQSLQEIVGLAQAILRYSEAQPVKGSDSLFMVRQCLELARTGVARYLETTRYVPASAQQFQEKLAELLDNIFSTLQHLHSRQVAEETADLSGELTALNRTLKELDQISLSVGSGENNK